MVVGSTTEKRGYYQCEKWSRVCDGSLLLCYLRKELNDSGS